MAEMILPGTYIEVRPEGLITPGRVTVNNIGIVGTASKGPVGRAVNLGSFTQAREIFGNIDAFDPGNIGKELTLVRALELAFAHGTTTAYAVRVTGTEPPGENSENYIPAWNQDTTARRASFTLLSDSGSNVVLRAKTPGQWGNQLTVNVKKAEQNAFIEEEVDSDLANLQLDRPFSPNARNRVRRVSNGLSRPLAIKYEGGEALVAGEVQIKNDRTLAFFTGEEPVEGETIVSSYMVPLDKAAQVTIRHGRTEETYTVADGNDLIEDINRNSTLVEAEAGDHPDELPSISVSEKDNKPFTGGKNGVPEDMPAAIKLGLEALLNVDAHIIVAAGVDENIGDELDAHVQLASTDAIKRDRIAVVGSAAGGTSDDGAMIDRLSGHNLASDRVIFVAPGLQVTDAASGQEVVLPGAYAAAAVAGLLASYPPHTSLTNKTLRVGGLERRFTSSQLTQLVQNRVLALEQRQGFRVVKGITTSTNTAWHQITTRRIVDYAKFGVRSAAASYIGLLNNNRVRGAMRTTINSFLAEMVDDEMLVSYELDVSASRDEERKGIARVTMVLRPTFSIDFIKVTMFLE